MHKIICKWFLFQERRHLITQNPDISTSDEDLSSDVQHPNDSAGSEHEEVQREAIPIYPPKEKRTLEKMVSYLKKEKRFPKDTFDQIDAA